MTNVINFNECMNQIGMGYRGVAYQGRSHDNWLDVKANEFASLIGHKIHEAAEVNRSVWIDMGEVHVYTPTIIDKFIIRIYSDYRADTNFILVWFGLSDELRDILKLTVERYNTNRNSTKCIYSLLIYGKVYDLNRVDFYLIGDGAAKGIKQSKKYNVFDMIMASGDEGIDTSDLTSLDPSNGPAISYLTFTHVINRVKVDNKRVRCYRVKGIVE